MKRFILALLVGVLPFATSVNASAHVRLDPSTAVVGRQVYGVRVPNEKDIPTVSVRLVVPDGVEVTGIQPIAGWTYTKKTMNVESETEESHSEGEEAAGGHGHSETTERVSEVTWSGGQIADGEYMVFYLNTKYDGDPVKLVWKAYQTYSDGTVVPWDDSSDDAPAPVVTITEKSAMETLQDEVKTLKTSQETSSSNGALSPTVNTWLAGGALVAAVVAIMLAVRKP